MSANLFKQFQGVAILIFCIVLGLDLVLKYCLPSQLGNTGIGFGLLADQGLMVIALNLLSYVVVTYLYFATQDKYIKIILLGLMIVSLSNLYDRLVLGFVRDYIPIWFGLQINLADIAVNILLLCIIGRLLLLTTREDRSRNSN